ncbi:MAG: manganese efflux pump [Clostridia bacterium]|jgi:putative Mn2+ efflux pump MntP|nr:manganese efflux pump [Clostridia bacterium]
MTLWELFIIAVGLSMDACAVSICKGLSVKKVTLGHAAICGGYFGAFQAIMPVIGFVLGVQFKDLITSVDHWIALILLCLIGANMIRESLSKEEEEMNCSFCFRAMLPLAIATSIDALAVGVTFAIMDIGSKIVFAVLFIGVITFILSAIGVKIGNVFGAKFKAKAEFFGGVVLILMGLKIFLEDLGILNLPF